jgi:hypothetical protein
VSWSHAWRSSATWTARSIVIETPTSLATNLIIQFVGCRLNDRNAATRELIDELRGTRAGDSSGDRLGNFPSRVPKQGCRDAQFLRELVRRQAQRRECAFGHVECDSDHRRLSGQDKGWWRKRLWSVRSKRGAAPRELLPIVSRLSANNSKCGCGGSQPAEFWSSPGPRRRTVRTRFREFRSRAASHTKIACVFNQFQHGVVSLTNLLTARSHALTRRPLTKLLAGDLLQ